MVDNGLPFVSVIIPVYKNWVALQLCLESLRHQTYPSSSYEVIVVDNDCSTDYSSFKNLTKGIRIIRESKTGSYAARNKGIEQAKGEILAFTDSDCLPNQDWIEEGVKVFQSTPGLTRVAGPVDLEFLHPEKHHPVELYEKVFAFPQEKKVKQEGTSVTANLFVCSNVFSSLGLFNENLKSGGDIEWGRKANSAGFEIVFAPQVRVFHPARRTWSSIARKGVRIYGGFWELTDRRNRSILRNLIGGIGIFKSSAWRISTTLSTTELQTFTERLKVIVVIVFIQLVQFYEHNRLLIGGQPRRN
jgi:glycosyltransferase involved in cell wall biosynthesis